MTGIPASLAFWTWGAMALESTASTRITSTFSEIICANWWACRSALDPALA